MMTTQYLLVPTYINGLLFLFILFSFLSETGLQQIQTAWPRAPFPTPPFGRLMVMALLTLNE